MRTLSKIILCLAFAATTAKAQTTTHMLGIGQSKILDTYLTPEHFSGTGYTYLYIKDTAPTDTLRRWTTTIERIKPGSLLQPILGTILQSAAHQ